MQNPTPARQSRATATWGPRLLLSGYLVVLLLVVGTVLPTLISTTRTLDRLQKRFDPASSATVDLLTGALNQETGLRAYAIAGPGNQQFLEPFVLGRAQVARAQRELQNKSLKPAIQRDVDDAVAKYRAWRLYADGVVAQVDRGDAIGAQQLIANGVGKARFDAFRTAQNRLSSAIEREVVSNRESLHDMVNRSIVTLLVAVAIGVLLVVVLWGWWRLADRRQAAAEQARADAGVLMQAVIDATTDSIFAKDPDGRHIVANRARAAALSAGDADAEVIGQGVDAFVDPALAARIRIDDNTILADGVEREVDEILRQPDGPHVFLTTKSPLRDANGRVIGVVGVARDVTEERALRADRERLYRMEHELAATLQRAMLGRNALEDDSRLDICAKYQPAAAQMSVGGDWYDVVALPDEKVGLIVGDVVGHGVESATAMGQLRSALAALAVTGRDPAATLDELEAFAFTIPDARSATCVYAVVDPAREVLSFSSAGHMPPIVVSGDGPPALLGDGQDVPLATVPEHRPRRSTTVGFPVGSTLVLYTDGLIERRREMIDVGFERLEVTLNAHRELSVEALCDRLIGDLLAGTEQRDDVAIVAARLTRTHHAVGDEHGASGLVSTTSRAPGA